MAKKAELIALEYLTDGEWHLWQKAVSLEHAQHLMDDRPNKTSIVRIDPTYWAQEKKPSPKRGR